MNNINLTSNHDNLFDLKDTKDLPFTINNLTHNKTQRIIDIFKKRNSLTTSEIRVAYYRLYQEEISSNFITASLNPYLKKNILKKYGRIYSLI